LYHTKIHSCLKKDEKGWGRKKSKGKGNVIEGVRCNFENIEISA
jgi:hypothetical protein